jgi:hypothetical protein
VSTPTAPATLELEAGATAIRRHRVIHDQIGPVEASTS